MQIKKTLIGLIGTVILIGAMGVSVFANNSSDTAYSFKVSNSKKYTSFRSKLDDTSATIKVSSGSKVIVYVHGSTLQITSSDCTYGTPKTVGISSTYTYLPNTVYEDDYSYARLAIKSATGSSFTSSGVWSPDSV